MAGCALAVGGICVRAWRSRPSELSSARKVDAELGLAEVVASGFAFERDRRDDEMAKIAITRSERAIEGFSFSKESGRRVPRTAREQRLLWAACAVAALAFAFGAIDRRVVERIVHPPTASELAAAAELRKTADEIARKDPENPRANQVAEAARRAADATERGDRQKAQEALEEMRSAARSLEAEQREQSKALKSVKDELEGKGSVRGTSLAESLLKMAKSDPATRDPEEVKRMLERLDRAEAQARAMAGKSPKSGASPSSSPSASTASGWQRAADALREAREASARGDAEGAKAALAKAEAEVSKLEKQRGGSSSSAQAMSKLGDGASELGRSLSNESSGLSKPSKGDEPGGGKGAGDRTPGAEQRRLKMNGDLQARSDVREGERAVSVIEGLGHGGDPKAYREIFPAYDTIVEDGLRDDVVPAARRPAVRRYFSDIRPKETTPP